MSSKKLWAVHVLVALGVMAAYALVFILAIGDAWQRNEERLPPAQPWVESIRSAVVRFPFSYVGVSHDILALVLLNGLFWGGASVALLRLCARGFRGVTQRQ